MPHSSHFGRETHLLPPDLLPLADADMLIYCSSKAFFYAQGVTIIGEMLAPPLGAYLMRTSLWVPIIIGFACLLLAVSLTVLMPETRFTALASDSQDDEHAHHGPVPSESEEIPLSRGSKVESGLKRRLEVATSHTLSTVGFVLQHRNLVLLMAGFFSTDFAQQSLTVILRYVSARYSVSLAEVFIIHSPSISFIHRAHKRFTSATSLCENDDDADLKTIQILGQLLVLLPGFWTDAGIRHHTAPP